MIKQCWNNSTVKLQYDASKMRYNMRRIKPYISYRNVGDINPKNMCDDDNILLPVIYFRLIVKLGNEICNHMSMEKFT